MTMRFVSISRAWLPLALSCIPLVGCDACRTAAPVPPATPAEAPAQAPTDPAAGPVGSAGGRYTGSVACRECHRAVYDAWEASRHHRTVRPVGRSASPRLAGATLPGGFAVSADGVVTGPGPDGSPVRVQAAYLVGTRHREDLWVRMQDGRLQVFPIAYDLDAGAPFEPLAELGGSAPPPDTIDFWTRLGRNADLTCHACHTTGAVVVPSATGTNGHAVPRSRWVESGVGCEACHGPGGRHVDAAHAGAPSKELPHQRKGDAASRSRRDVCAACHGLRELLSSPVGLSPAHAYGEPLSSFADPLVRYAQNFEFRDPVLSDLRPGTYQQEAAALSESGCARKGALDCSACHDVHSGVLTSAAAGTDGGDGVCLACHRDTAGATPAHRWHATGTPGARCFACHMAPIVRGPGRDPARDHTLAPPVASREEIPGACVACHRPGGAATPRAIAAWRAFTPASHASLRRAAFVAAFRADPESASAVRMLDTIAGDAAESPFVRIAALTRLVPPGPLPSPRELPGVRAALKDADPAVRRAALRALAAAGAPSDVERIRALGDDPDRFVALETTSALAALGDPGAGLRATRLIRRPDLAAEFRTHLLLGRLALSQRDWPRAENAIAKALEINPFVVPAWNDIAIARFSQRNFQGAREGWRRALELNPRFYPAKKNLEQMTGAR